MASDVPSPQDNKKEIFIDPSFRIRWWGYAKQIFIDPDFRSRVFHAAFFSRRSARNKIAGIAALLVIVGSNAGNFNDIVAAGSTVWQTARGVLDHGSNKREAEATARQQRIDYQEKMSSEMYDEVKRLQAVVTEKTKLAAITPTNTDIVAAFNAKPGSEKALIEKRQESIAALLQSDPATASAANQLLDLMDKAAACGPEKCDLDKWNDDYAKRSCQVHRTLALWTGVMRKADPSFVPSFSARVGKLDCDTLLYRTTSLNA